LLLFVIEGRDAMPSHRCALIAPLVAAILLIQCGSRLEARRSQRVFDVTTAHGVFDGTPWLPAEVFRPDEMPIYVWFRCDGCAVGTVIGSSWFYLDSDPPVRFAHGSVTVETAEDFGEFHCELAPGKRWPIGAYRIELRIDEVRMADVSFRVAIETNH
jgi:hypothetical protein